MLRLYDSVQQFISKSGVPLSSGKVWVFLNGTDDLASVYADPNGLVPLSNPVSIDDDGRTLGAFVDENRVYRIEVRGPSGNLEWSVYPVSPLGGSGSGGTGVIPVIVSSDGSVRVDETVDGNRIIFDLSAHVEESVDSLAWYRGDGGTVSGDIYVPGKTAGTLEQGDAGVWLPGEQYFHVTYHVRAQKTSAQPYYDKADLLIQLMDGDTFAVTNVCRRGVIVDWSMGLSQDFEFSCDVKTEGAAELQLRILSQDVQGGNFTLLDTEIHRVYSGAPYIPGGAGGGDYEGENGILVNNTARTIAADTSVLQPKLTAGENISIVGNTISATAAPQVNSDWNAVSGVARILNKPDLSLYVTDSELETILSGYATSSELTYGLAGKQNVLTAGTGIDITGNTISCTASFTQQQADWAQTDSSAVDFVKNKPDLSVYATTQAMNTALAGKQDTISDLSDIRSGAALGATAVQPATLNDYATTSAMNTALAGKQDTISDLSDIRSGAALGATAVQPSALDDYVTGSELATTLADYVTDTELGTILDGYATTTALSNGLAGKQDTISDLNDIRSGAALGATAVQPAALNDYATTSAMNTALAGKQDTLTAGTGIDITGNTISATGTTYTAGSGLSLTGTEFSVDTSTIATKSDLAGKQDVINDLSDIRSGAALGSTAVQPATLNDYVTNSSLRDTLSYYPTNSDLASSLNTKQNKLTAGTGIAIANNVISCTETQQQADWAQSDSSAVDYIKSKPSTKPLVAGTGLTITEGVNDVTLDCTVPSVTIGTVSV